MARSVNKVILIGNLGDDPDLRYTQSGTAVCNMSLATNETYVDQDGNEQTQTEWHDIVAWNRLAETCNEYLSKGSKIHVEGMLQTNQWTDRDGNTRYSTEVKARDVMFLDSNRQQSAERGGPPPNQRRRKGGEGQGQPGGSTAGGSPSGDGSDEEDAPEPDDDLPF